MQSSFGAAVELISAEMFIQTEPPKQLAIQGLVCLLWGSQPKIIKEVAKATWQE